MTEKRTAHPYFMYEAIGQQPDRVAKLLDTGRALLERAGDAAAARKRILFVAIGTSYHAAQIGEHFLRHLSGGRAQAQVEQSFELVHYPLALGPDDALVIISHRGWKNYSVQALNAAKDAGALTIAITGQPAAAGGEEMKAADFVLPTCEQEQSFAHTKSYTTGLAAVATLAIRITEQRGLLRDAPAARAALDAVPEAMRQALRCEEKAREVAPLVAGRQRWLFVGAGPNWATAREGALKVKETSYIASEGYQTEQFLHGPISEVDSRAALVVHLAGGPGDARVAPMLRALGELGVLRVIVAAAGQGADFPAEHRIEVPPVAEWLSPFVQVIPSQFLAYFVALARGSNPDTGREDQPQHARAHELFKL